MLEVGEHWTPLWHPTLKGKGAPSSPSHVIAAVTYCTHNWLEYNQKPKRCYPGVFKLLAINC